MFWVEGLAYENQVITTRSNAQAFPSSLRQKKTSLVQQREVEKKKVYVDEDCEKCGNKQMSVKTMQLRSADEGGKPSPHPPAPRPAMSPTLQPGADKDDSRSYCVLLVRAVRAPDPAQQLGPAPRRARGCEGGPERERGTRRRGGRPCAERITIML